MHRLSLPFFNENKTLREKRSKGCKRKSLTFLPAGFKVPKRIVVRNHLLVLIYHEYKKTHCFNGVRHNKCHGKRCSRFN